jgi:PKHD-type hydroxylase
MFHVVGPLFSPPELEAVVEAVATLDWEDGAKTAGALARDVKSNAQAVASPARDALLRKAEAALMGDAGFVSAARPKGFARLLISRYAGGQTYGAHVDDALMGGARTDLSFTIFLSDPESYTGGELVVVDRLEDRAFKLNPGEALVYPSDTLHRVEPVTEGVRLAIVGWATSWVRDAGKREVLFDLDMAVAEARDAGASRTAVDRLARTRSNLLRMWAE